MTDGIKRDTPIAIEETFRQHRGEVRFAATHGFSRRISSDSFRRTTSLPPPWRRPYYRRCTSPSQAFVRFFAVALKQQTALVRL